MPHKEGDKVRVETEDDEFTGILMPRPDILEKGITVLKLDNGYNIGIESQKIKKIEVLEEYKQKVAKKTKLEHNKELPNVTIISTGGTISSKVDYRTGGTYATLTSDDFIEMMPELANIANIKAKPIMSKMSEDFDSDDWKKMAEEIVKESETADGIVLTMGTDTLHYAAAALSFFLDIHKPVIITAAQRSIDRGSSDAFMNLICAVSAAAKFDGAGVYVCMHATINDDYCYLIRGTKVRKMHTSRRDAFRAINEKPIAKVFYDSGLQVINHNYSKKKEEKARFNDKFENKIALIQVHPDMDPGVIDYYTEKNFKGIVLAATALGHVPTEGTKSLLPHIKKAIEKGVNVVIASQTLYGRVHPYVYTNLRKLSIELKCIFAEDMLPEVAYIKLGYVLAHTTEHHKVKEMMQTNLKGEINRRLMADEFLN